MKKAIAFLEKWWVIPVSILLWYYPIMPLGLILCAIISLATGSEYISIIVSVLGIGILSSLLILFKLKKSEQLEKRTKYILGVVTILMFSLLTYYLAIVKM